MKKKEYEAPKVKKVRLVISNSVLAVCHSSTLLDPQEGELSCMMTACYLPPTPTP